MTEPARRRGAVGLLVLAPVTAAGGAVAAVVGGSGARVLALALGVVGIEVVWMWAARTGRAGAVSTATMAMVVATAAVSASVFEYPGTNSTGFAAPLCLVASSMVASLAAASWRWPGEAVRRLCARPDRLVLWCLAAVPCLVLVQWRRPLDDSGLLVGVAAFLVATAILGLAVRAVVDERSLPAIPAGITAMAGLSLFDLGHWAGASVPAAVALTAISVFPLVLVAVLVAWAEAVERGRVAAWMTVVVVATTSLAAAVGPDVLVVAGVVLAGMVAWLRRGDQWVAEVFARRPPALPLFLWAWAAIAALAAGYQRVPGVDLLQPVKEPQVWLVATLPAAMGLVALTLGDVVVRRTSEHNVEVRSPRCLVLGLTLLVVGVAAVGITSQWQRNHDPDLTDQGAYVQYAEHLRAQPAVTVLDRNRMPVYPFLLSRMIEPDEMSTNLETGKALGVMIAVAGSVTVGWWLRRRAGWLGALAGFSVFVLSVAMFKAPFAQADLAFFFLLLTSAVCCWRLLRAPSAMRGAITGLVLGLTQLTKANASIMLIALLVVGTVAVLLPRSWSGLTPASRRAMPLALASVVGLFLAVMAPYFANSKTHYDDPLFNANSSYTIWYDNLPEAFAAQRAHEQPLPGAGAPDPVPRWGRYLDVHGLDGVVERFRRGFAVQYERASSSYGFFPLLGLALLASAAAYATAPRRLGRSMRAPVAFGLLVVATYLAFTAWWMWLGQGERFILVMFLPVLALSLIAVDRFGRDRWVVWRGRAMTLSSFLFTGLIFVVLLQLPALIYNVLTISGGE